MEPSPDFIKMLFHPLMDLDREHVEESSLLIRDDIKILTYNIFIRPPPVKNNENDYKEERLDEFIKILNKFDVICLQEMFGSLSSRRHKLIKRAYKSGLFYQVESPSPSFFSKNMIDAGLVILSRFPIIESEFRAFKYTVLACSLVEKGVLYAKIQIKDSCLIVFNLHLQASYFDEMEELHDICLKTRLSQFEEAAEYIKEILESRDIKDNDRILLMGDFNVDSHNFANSKNSTRECQTNTQKDNLEEYKYLFQILNKKFVANDLLKKKYEKHPYTYGMTGDLFCKKYDLVLTDKRDRANLQTLDYIFELSKNKKTVENIKLEEKVKNLSIDYNSIQVEEFLIDNKPFQQLSDHFGVSIEINYNKTN